MRLLCHAETTCHDKYLLGRHAVSIVINSTGTFNVLSLPIMLEEGTGVTNNILQFQPKRLWQIIVERYVALLLASFNMLTCICGMYLQHSPLKI